MWCIRLDARMREQAFRLSGMQRPDCQKAQESKIASIILFANETGGQVANSVG